MCGILGLFPGTRDDAATALGALAHRGRDASNLLEVEGGLFGHVLHKLVGDVPQPVSMKGTLVFNGEIYNWKEIATGSENDTQALLTILDSDQKVQDVVSGVYAFAYLRDGKLLVQRDLLGVKPLFYCHSEQGFAFASEAKALRSIGLEPRELHPRTTLQYDLQTNNLDVRVRSFTFATPSMDLCSTLTQAVLHRVPESKRCGVLFSGGIDSAIIAHILRGAGVDVTLYVAALDDPDKSTPVDLEQARSAANMLDLPLVEVSATCKDVEKLLPIICSAIEDSSVVKVGVALPLWLCSAQASQDGQRVLFSGLGAEEVFAGYQRHKEALDVNKECLRGLRRMHERDLYRDDVVGMMHTLEIRLPFLDHAVVGAGLEIPGEEKIISGVGKMPLRNAAITLGLPKEIAMRPKKAAQYGSQFDAAIWKAGKEARIIEISIICATLYPSIRKLCALLSSGKDSVYALYTMQRMNYEIACCATIISTNPHSYMYHTPVISFASEQAASMGLPFLCVETAGEKEEELSALKDVLQQAIVQYKINGVVSGALFSDYQRSRIEHVCEELGLQVYAPLWHLDQEQEVREVIDAGFSFVMSRVAADGLDKSWVGRTITHEDVDVLVKKLHLNIAGEGGEYETLVIDGPNFKEPLNTLQTRVVCEKDGSSGDVCELVRDN